MTRQGSSIPRLPWPSRHLPTMQVVSEDGSCPPVDLVTISATLEPGVPRRALTVGSQRSSTDNHGRSVCLRAVGSARTERPRELPKLAVPLGTLPRCK
jgi:hypothetical protein